MSSGSSSSAQVCGTNPYSTGNTTEEGITLSRTNASHSERYSYLSLDPLATSTTTFKIIGGFSPAGMSFHMFMSNDQPFTRKLVHTNLGFLDNHHVSIAWKKLFSFSASADLILMEKTTPVAIHGII
jgi:hypothetical protein